MELAPIVVDGPIHGVDLLDRDVVGHVRTGCVKDVLQQIRHREHRWTVVESEACRLDHPRSTTRNRITFHHRHRMSRSRQVRGGGQPTETCADDNNLHYTTLHDT